jgi:excisionase family DNA binding protein
MERPSGWVSVREAASQLGVQPEQVRELIADGRVAAAKIGHELLVRSDSVHHRAHVVRPKAGRKWSPRIAWAVLWVASDLRPDWVSSAELVRVHRYAQSPLDQWPRLAAGRAVNRELMMLSPVLKKFVDRPGVCVGGVEAAIAHGAPLVVGDDHPREFYVSGAVSDELSSARGVRWNSDSPNVLLRILPDVVAKQVKRMKVAPRAVAAADLLDLGDERSVLAANDLLGAGP